jgi:hypothetical protein
MTNFEYYRTLVIGVIIGASTVILGFYMSKPEPQPITQPTLQSITQTVPSKGIFKVIDRYKDCDLIQYQYNLLTEYKYFLDCPK